MKSESVLRLKLPLTQSTKDALQELLESVDQELQKEATAVEKKEKQAAMRAQLANEVAALQKRFDESGATDFAALEQLASKKSQLGTFSDSLDSQENRGRGSKEAATNFHVLMVQLFQELKPLFNIYFEEVLEDLTTRLRPFCQSTTSARTTGQQTWLAIYFCTWRNNLVNPLQTKRCVTTLAKIARQILKGEDFFPFDAKMEGDK